MKTSMNVKAHIELHSKEHFKLLLIKSTVLQILYRLTESSCFSHFKEHHWLLFHTVINLLAILNYKKLNKMGGCISKDSANAEDDDEIVDHETKGD